MAEGSRALAACRRVSLLVQRLAPCTRSLGCASVLTSDDARHSEPEDHARRHDKTQRRKHWSSIWSDDVLFATAVSTSGHRRAAGKLSRRASLLRTPNPARLILSQRTRR